MINKNVLIAGMLGLTLVGCKEPAKQAKEAEPTPTPTPVVVPLNPGQTTDITLTDDYGQEEPEIPVIITEDIKEEKEIVVEEVEDFEEVKEDDNDDIWESEKKKKISTDEIDKFAFISKKNETYYCELDSDTKSLTVNHKDKKLVYNNLDETVFYRLLRVIMVVLDDESGFSDKAVKVGVRESAVDPESWLGIMVYSIARGDEKRDHRTYYQYGIETLDEFEKVVDEISLTDKTVPDTQDIKDVKEGSDGTVSGNTVSNNSADSKADSKDVYIFKMSKTKFDKAGNNDGLVTADALKTYCSANGLMDKLPFTIDDSKNYYFFSYCNTSVDVKKIEKKINGDTIIITGNIDYSTKKRDSDQEEVYIAIPVDKTLKYSKNEIVITNSV